MGSELLFEIGVEEIPPGESPILASQLQDLARKHLDAERLSFSNLKSLHTPRRLVLIAEDLADEQPAIETEVRGPSKKAAYDAEGNPTKAAEGFSKGHGLSVDDLYVRELLEGEYVFGMKQIPARKTSEVLIELLPMLIDKLSPSETMRWDESEVKFIRPIRWIVALFAANLVEFDYGCIKSGNMTRGHRFLGKRDLKITGVEDYLNAMAKNGVLLHEDERKARITDALDEIAHEINATPSLSDALLDEIANNLEHPAPVLGQFPSEFLGLPREILETTIVVHQKFVPFVVGDKPSQYFVGFRDGSDGSDDQVRAGYERVVKARLRDSEFFFEEDRQTTLAERTQILRRVVYQEKLGSIWDKTERMRKLAAEIAKRCKFKSVDEIDRTLFLCKADLLTTMVGEFPELEGIVGGLYAKLEGEPALVADGIYEHYKPKSAHDSLPQSETGIVASLADKLDTVIGSLLIGAEVTGSRDPFGLRRRANGIIQIVFEHELNLDLFDLIDSSESTYDFLGEELDFERVKIFFTERLKAELRDEMGIAYDIVDAVAASGDGILTRALKRARALEAIRTEDQFQSLVVAFERACNITRKEEINADYNPEMFTHEAETALWRAARSAEAQIEKLLPKEDYKAITQELIKLRAPIDHYFDEVLVMDKDDRQRKNKLGFLTSIVKLFFSVGDLSKIVVEGESD